MSQLYVLFEHASGYALFQTVEYEEIAMLLPQVEQSIQDLGKFRAVVKLTAFMPFKTAANALDNINSISEGILHSDVQLFLETNVPKSKKKKQAVILGVGDPKVGAAISEALGITCQSTGVVAEITRGIRLHFHNLVKGLTEQSVSKAQLGLGHSYSRAKVKFNINRVDNMIIQSISLLDQLDKDINTFAMRVREWYSYHFPELIKIVPENSLYAQAVMIIKNRKEMADDTLTKLEEVLMDSEKAQAILEASRSSMGMDISPIDLINIQAFASRVVALAKYRKELMEYLKSKMQNIAPNLATLIGETVGARLISHAGSLTNLAKYPASTVQILGAEKALFRALKTRGNTPKYGLIFHSTFIGKAAKQNKGRISRYLANKCSIASRIDCFSEIPTDIFGCKLKKQVEDRLKFYETGDIPPKNIDVMSEAVDEASIVQEKLLKKKKKKEKKDKKKRKLEEEETADSSVIEQNLTDEREVVVDTPNQEFSEIGIKSPKKKKKKQDELLDAQFMTNEDSEQNVTIEQKKKKKMKQDMSPNIVYEANNEVSQFDGIGEKKKKKKKKGDESLNTTYTSNAEVTDLSELNVSEERKKKKKKKKTQEEEESMNVEDTSQNSILNSTGVNVENSLETESASIKKSKKKKKKFVDE